MDEPLPGGAPRALGLSASASREQDARPSAPRAPAGAPLTRTHVLAAGGGSPPCEGGGAQKGCESRQGRLGRSVRFAPGPGKRRSLCWPRLGPVQAKVPQECSAATPTPRCRSGSRLQGRVGWGQGLQRRGFPLLHLVAEAGKRGGSFSESPSLRWGRCRKAGELSDACVSARAFAVETGRTTYKPLGGTPGFRPLYGSGSGAWRVPGF